MVRDEEDNLSRLFATAFKPVVINDEGKVVQIFITFGPASLDPHGELLPTVAFRFDNLLRRGPDRTGEAEHRIQQCEYKNPSRPPQGLGIYMVFLFDCIPLVANILPDREGKSTPWSLSRQGVCLALFLHIYEEKTPKPQPVVPAPAGRYKLWWCLDFLTTVPI